MPVSVRTWQPDVLCRGPLHSSGDVLIVRDMDGILWGGDDDVFGGVVGLLGQDHVLKMPFL